MNPRTFLVFLTLLIPASATADFDCPKGMVKTGLNSCIDTYEWPNRAGEIPAVAQSAIKEQVSKGILDAESLCRSVGKRPCSRREWVASCSDGTKHPYGNEKKQSCNTNKKWSSVDEHKVYIRDKSTLDALNKADPAGSNEGCTNGLTYDMEGNVEEWVTCSDGTDGWCLVGGYWASTEASCNYVIRKHSPRWHYYQTGFRCCK